MSLTTVAALAPITPSMYRRAKAQLPATPPAEGAETVVAVPPVFDPPWYADRAALEAPHPPLWHVSRVLTTVAWRWQGGAWRCLNPLVTWDYLARYGRAEEQGI